MAFQQGLSGLNVAGRALDVTSNNIANASTVGFKFSRSNFADVYGASMTAGGGSMIGIGVSLAAVQQQFTQGNFSTTNNPLDLAINGAGFYRVEQGGVETYTRNGQFHLDKDGFIVNDQGRRLIGVQALPTGEIPELSDSATGPMNVSESVGTPAVTTSIKMKANLNGNAAFPNDGATPPVQLPAPLNWDLSGTNMTTAGDLAWGTNWYNNARSMDVYDSQGGAHTMTFYYRKMDPTGAAGGPGGPNVWEIYATIQDVDETGATVTRPATDGAGGVMMPTATLVFNTNGTLDASLSTIPSAVGFSSADGTTLSGGPTIPGQVSALAIAMNFDNVTQFKSPFAVESLVQDGYAKGNLAGLAVGPDGTIQARYDNGKTTNIGQLVLYNFANPNGLQPIGNNQWAETATSGQPTSNFPGLGNTGVIQSAAVEESNVDLTQELVNLIIQQRNYQANAQSIKTQDQVLQTLVNMR